MKGPVILLLLALTALVNQAASEHVFEHKAEKMWDHFDLLLMLGEPMAGYRSEEAQKVFILLRQAIDDGKKERRIKDFTVAELIKLNEWFIEDCEDDKLERRRSICAMFSTREDTNRHVPEKRPTEDGDYVASENDQILLNLGKYCWATIADMERKCPSKRLEALDEVDKKRLTSFKNKIFFGKLSFKQLIKPDQKKLIVKNLKKLEETNPSEAEKLKETCSFIVNESKKSGAHFDDSWRFKISICQVIHGIEHDATQPELDDASLPVTQSAEDDQASS